MNVLLWRKQLEIDFILHGILLSDLKYHIFHKIPKIHNMNIRLWGNDVSLSIILTSMFQFYVTMRTFFNHNRYCKLLKGILEKVFYRQLETLWILSAFNTYDYHIRFVLNTFKIISISFVLYGYILLMRFFYALNMENRKDKQIKVIIIQLSLQNDC